MYGEKNAEKKLKKKKQFFYFAAGVLNPRGNRLKEWRKREETQKFIPPVDICTLEFRN